MSPWPRPDETNQFQKVPLEPEETLPNSMNPSLILLISVLAVTAAPGPIPGAAPSPPDKPTAAEAKSTTGAWIKALPKAGLVLNEKRAESGFVGRPIAGSKNTMFVLSDGPWYITLGFEGAVSADTPLETLREKFSYIALDRVPLPGLDLPGWKVRAQTPMSSIRKKAKAVEILKAGGGKITFRVKTHFFAIYGSDPSVLVPADAPSPAGSYFQIRERFDLDLTIEAPFGLKE